MYYFSFYYCASLILSISGVLFPVMVDSVGINYGQIANNLPSPDNVVPLVKSIGATKVKLYDADARVLRAFANTGVEFIVGLGNEYLSKMRDPDKAQAWIKSNVQAYLPATKITCITVGNEVLTFNDTSLSDDLLLAMQSVHTALVNLGLDKQVSVTTPHSLAILETSYPPSAGAFRRDRAGCVTKILNFHAKTGSPFMINAYPYFAYKGNVTAAVTFAFAALFFFFCTKIRRRNSGGRQNDEKPLLSLSLSNYSTGSPHNSFGLVNSIKEEKVDHQSLNKNSSHHGKDSSLDSIKSTALHASPDEIALSAESIGKFSDTIAWVPPPPGRVDSMLPLQPPPGRAVPLPPEPPASLRPPTRKTDLSPPPPPPPPRAPLPPPPPMAPGVKSGPPPPPPPPKGGPAPSQPPPPLPMGSKVPRPPTGLKHPPNAAPGERDGAEGDANNPKAKLKPFFWDKVLANPDHSMVWHQIKSGSFQFNEEMIETLFGYAPADRNKTDRKKESSSQDSTFHYIQILDTKKAQNLSILLRALNVTIEEVCDALHEGNELPIELLQTLLKMAPTADEELKLRLYSGELSQLGNAERFLKMLVDIPFAYKRLEALLFMCTLQEEVAMTKESFDTLEVACKELRNSRLFLKLLEAVLKTGNRMNDGTFRGGAQAFKLDTLLKLSDVKGTDGKTTLLHFVVQEIIRSEGVRAARVARESHTFSNISVKSNDLLEDITADTEYDYSKLGLQVVSCLSSELGNVKKAAIVDPDSLTGTVAKLGNSLLKTQDFLNKDMKSLGEDSKFHETLKSVVQNAEVDIMWLLEEEKRIMALVKSTGDYFHGNAGKDEGLRLFVIVRDFLIILDKVCKQVGEAQKRSEKLLKKESSTASSNSSTSQQPSPDFRTRLFPAIQERKIENSSSDDENE